MRGAVVLVLATGLLGLDASASPTAGESFRDCAVCPEMAAIPGGSFVMGSPEDELGRDADEGPQRRVTVAPFALGRYPVTFAEWDACLAEGGCGGFRPGDEGWGRGDRPVINVSWDDAQAYVAWLNGKAQGAPYRLPSEAEWEYAARAGAETPFWWGERVSTDQANYDGTYTYEGAPEEGPFRGRTLPVRSFEPNPFGLYQVHGNVWEWAADCWNDSYLGAPTDGAARTTGDCASAPLRGGTWYYGPEEIRAAFRYVNLRDARYGLIGFRVARSLPLGE